MIVHYECWTHQFGDNFLVRFDEANAITGVCGPLRRSDIPKSNMLNYDYDSQPQHTEWIRTHQSEFHEAVEGPPIAMD